jgi:tRNA C32,U32 (ribose-2'-O)-methylase TrmJ
MTATVSYDLLSRIAIVLDHPKNVVNIAGVTRVMQNFGLKTLRLVNPKEFDAYRIEGIAHRSTNLINATTLHATLQDAVGDAAFILGTTGRGVLSPKFCMTRVTPAIFTTFLGWSRTIAIRESRS